MSLSAINKPTAAHHPFCPFPGRIAPAVSESTPRDEGQAKPAPAAEKSVGFWKRLEAEVQSLRRYIQKLEQENNRLKITVHLDPLTGLQNRRSLEQALQFQFQQLSNQPKGLAVLMLDLDVFGQIKKDVSHQAGDKVLKHFGAVLMNGLRQDDLAFRYGGEEFTILLPNTTAEEARQIGERLLNQTAAISQTEFSRADDADLRKLFQTRDLSCSIGLFHLQELNGIQAPAQLLGFADLAARKAKEMGRNRMNEAKVSPAGEVLVTHTINGPAFVRMPQKLFA